MQNTLKNMMQFWIRLDILQHQSSIRYAIFTIKQKAKLTWMMIYL